VTTDPRVAVVGLGQMGAGIARNLERAGLLAAVHDIRPDACDAFSAEALSGQALADKSDIVLFVVPTTSQVGASMDGCTGSALIIDLTTSAPAQSEAMSENLGQRGFAYLDAAMTGGAAGADAGRLTLMVGGDDRHVAQAKPVFDVIAEKAFHLGPAGSGHAMKLVHNLILHSAFLATCEGLRLADRAGLDLNTAVDVLNAGNARSFVTEVRFPRDILSGDMNARSTIANLAKDLGLAGDFAASHDAPAPYTELTTRLLLSAMDAGHSGTDFSHLFPLYETLHTQADQ